MRQSTPSVLPFMLLSLGYIHCISGIHFVYVGYIHIQHESKNVRAHIHTDLRTSTRNRVLMWHYRWVRRGNIHRHSRSRDHPRS